jgi:hypothetical protein
MLPVPYFEIREAEAGGSRAQGQPELHNKTLPQQTNNKKSNGI